MSTELLNLGGFQSQTGETIPMSAATKIGETRALAEIQAACIMAKRDPRNENQCYMAIIEACKRPLLADQSMYAFPRGGKMVTGASIRLAEVLAQKWKNMRIGVTITNQTAQKTEARAYAYDLETNYMVDQEFVVPHQRTTKQGVKTLTDERDIRELVANIGSRHLRGCILRVVPGDVLEGALAQCKHTQESSDVPIKEQVRKMVVAFDELGVKVEHLEKRLGHNLDATIPTEIVTLKSIYKSIRDGMADRSDFFDLGLKDNDAADTINQLIDKKKKEKDDQK